MTYRAFFIALLVIAAAGQASASHQVHVAPNLSTVNRPSGESQSTVVPPDKKLECPNGRFLVSLDSNISLPPPQGMIIGRDFGDPSNTDIRATFDNVPNPEWYQLSVDPDLVTLSNGDVLYLGHARSRAPLDPKPTWFDVTYRNNFGPGARSVVMVWRSTDCGQTFQFVSVMDSAHMEDGTCALPQMPNPDDRLPTDPPGSQVRPVFDMGGSDGPLTKVDLSNDRVYLVFQCVGNVPDTSQPYFNLTNTKLNKTLVLVSYNKGGSWSSLGFIENRMRWRLGIAPLAYDRLAFALGNEILFGTKTNSRYQFGNTSQHAPHDSGWEQHADDYFGQNPVLGPIRANYVGGHILGHTMVARSPGSDNLVLVFPDTITDNGNNKSHGFRLYFYDDTRSAFAEADPIMPDDRSLNSFLMHPVIIDLGTGPLLLYWTDINGVTKQAVVRGRFIYGSDRCSSDFLISRVGGNKHSWDVTNNVQAPTRYWYGDYQTASGFKVPVDTTDPFRLAGKQYRYFPMWVQSDGTVRYTQVTLIEQISRHHPLAFDELDIDYILPEEWRPAPPVPIDQRLNPREQPLLDYWRIKQKEAVKDANPAPTAPALRPLSQEKLPETLQQQKKQPQNR